MNKEQIKEIIPHRDHMLLIDEVESTDENKAIGHYTVRGDEWFLQGHFPGNPVVPGVILCEIMAQTCCILIAEKIKGRTPYFTGINKVRFRHVVLPGETIDLECSLIKEKNPFFFAEGKGYVNGKLCVSGEFSFALIDTNS